MPARTVTAASIDLRTVGATEQPGAYQVSIEYLVIFNDGSSQARAIERTVSAGSVKIALDTLFSDFKARIGAREGIAV